MSDDLDELKADLPEETHEVFDELAADGYNPAGVAATIAWLTKDISQEQAVEMFGSSRATINRYTDVVADRLGVDVEDARQPSYPESVKNASYRRIIDILELEEGVHFSRRGDGGGGEKLFLLAEGVKQVADALEEAASERSEGGEP